jgi:hypothetical protein
MDKVPKANRRQRAADAGRYAPDGASRIFTRGQRPAGPTRRLAACAAIHGASSPSRILQ